MSSDQYSRYFSLSPKRPYLITSLSSNVFARRPPISPEKGDRANATAFNTEDTVVKGGNPLICLRTENLALKNEVSSLKTIVTAMEKELGTFKLRADIEQNLKARLEQTERQMVLLKDELDSYKVKDFKDKLLEKELNECCLQLDVMREKIDTTEKLYSKQKIQLESYQLELTVLRNQLSTFQQYNNDDSTMEKLLIYKEEAKKRENQLLQELQTYKEQVKDKESIIKVYSDSYKRNHQNNGDNLFKKEINILKQSLEEKEKEIEAEIELNRQLQSELDSIHEITENERVSMEEEFERERMLWKEMETCNRQLAEDALKQEMENYRRKIEEREVSRMQEIEMLHESLKLHDGSGAAIGLQQPIAIA